MIKEIVFLSVLVASPLITSANIPSDIQERYLATVRRGEANKNYVFPVSPPWNPIQLITNDPLLTQLCERNRPGNYQYPKNCSQFIMCAGPTVYLAECSPGTGSYSPIADLCGYYYPPPAESCPWKSIWTYPDGVSCQTLGQRPFWGDLTFPTNPEERCGSDIVYCNKYQQTGMGSCDSGYGYSKVFLACLDLETCKAIDKSFGL